MSQRFQRTRWEDWPWHYWIVAFALGWVLVFAIPMFLGIPLS